MFRLVLQQVSLLLNQSKGFKYGFVRSFEYAYTVKTRNLLTTLLAHSWYDPGIIGHKTPREMNHPIIGLDELDVECIKAVLITDLSGMFQVLLVSQN